MKKALLIILIILGLILLITYFVNPEFISKIWLWLVGLAGVIIASLKKVGSIFSGHSGQSIADVKSENESIKKELDNIRVAIADTENRLKQERELHERELSILKIKLELTEKQIAAEIAYREKLQKMTYNEYKDSINSGEREKFEHEIWNDVKF